jgi:hypothetical protein
MKYNIQVISRRSTIVSRSDLSEAEKLIETLQKTYPDLVIIPEFEDVDNKIKEHEESIFVLEKIKYLEMLSDSKKDLLKIIPSESVPEISFVNHKINFYNAMIQELWKIYYKLQKFN